MTKRLLLGLFPRERETVSDYFTVPSTYQKQLLEFSIVIWWIFPCFWSGNLDPTANGHPWIHGRGQGKHHCHGQKFRTVLKQEMTRVLYLFLLLLDCNFFLNSTTATTRSSTHSHGSPTSTCHADSWVLASALNQDSSKSMTWPQPWHLAPNAETGATTQKALAPCSKIKQARREGATTLTRTDVGDEILHISLLQ